MSVVIKTVRMSLVWSTSFTTLLNDNPPASVPLAGLGNRKTYEFNFNNLQKNPEAPVSLAPIAPALVLPWRPKGNNYFWIRYLNCSPITGVKGGYAFRRLVPLRRYLPPLTKRIIELDPKYIKSDLDKLEQIQMITEAWFHSHMVSFAVHFTIKGVMSLKTTESVCLRLRRDAMFNSSSQKLDWLANQELQKLYLEAVGEENLEPLPMIDPFSVVTILQGEGTSSEEPITVGDEVHKYLETVTQWRENRQDSLLTGRISSHEIASPPGNVTHPLLFGRNSNRAVWDPERFLPQLPHINSLSCYHNNLIASTIQTKALLKFAHLDQVLSNSGYLPTNVRECEDTILSRLINLHRGLRDTGTYCSYNLKRVIDESPFRSSVDEIALRRSSSGLPPLS